MLTLVSAELKPGFKDFYGHVHKYQVTMRSQMTSSLPVEAAENPIAQLYAKRDSYSH